MTTAPIILQPGIARRRFSAPTSRVAVETIARPAAVAQEELVELFDAVVLDVYGRAFMATQRQADAERVTSAVVTKLGRAVSRGMTSESALRATAYETMTRELAVHQRRNAKSAALRDVQSLTRRLFLAGSAAFAAFYAAYLIAVS